MASITLKPEVLRHVVDVHCHPTDAGDISPDSVKQLEITICAMSSHKADQNRVAALAESNPDKVIPSFGYHPWFSHLISLDTSPSKEEHYRSLFMGDTPSSKQEEYEQIFGRLLPGLPDPTPLPEVLNDVRKNLINFPSAMIGEVGLDRIFRVPFDYFAEQRELTPFTIPLEHQITILEAQFELAIELKRNVSVHSVKAQQATLELLKRLAKRHEERWYRISVDMHSCGFSPETWRDTEKALSNVFLSLSTVINHNHSNLKKLITMASPHRLLVESDYNNIDKCTSQTLQILQFMAEVKGWAIEEEWDNELEESKWGAVRRLGENWKRFRAGDHLAPGGSKRARKKKLQDKLASDADSGSSP